MSDFAINPFYRLKEKAIESSSRQYKARGVLLKRCKRCQLGIRFCICQLIKPEPTLIHFIVIFHRDEIFKPTNSGRLIGELFPSNTKMYQWNRTSPDPQLIEQIDDTKFDTRLVFPSQPAVFEPATQTDVNRSLQLVILDGTWRQCRRMVNSASWLSNLPRVTLKPEQVSTYSTRSAAHKHYLSTAEATSLALLELDAKPEAVQLQSLFDEFNNRYRKMRRNQPAQD